MARSVVSPAIWFAVMLSTHSIGCSEPQLDDECVTRELWTPLNLELTQVVRLYAVDGALIVAAGPDGVWMQNPAVCGAWTDLGLSFPEYRESEPSFGVRTLAIGQDRMVAGCGMPLSDGRPRIYKRVRGQMAWDSVQIPLENVNIWDMTETECSTLLAMTTKGSVVSTTHGDSWQILHQNPWVNLAIYHNGPLDLLISHMTQVYEPRLVRSEDCGVTGSSITLAGDGVPHDGAILSIGSGLPDSAIAFVLGGDLWIARGLNSIFVRALSTRVSYPVVAMNPQNSDQVVVSADSLYLSHDSGVSWTTFAPPRGVLGQAIAADWIRNRIFVVDWFGGMAALYMFDLSKGLEDK